MYFFQSKIFQKYAKSNPIVLIDIGAGGGIQREWLPLKDNLQVFGFEPNTQEYRKLNKKAKENCIYFPLALYNKKGKMKINITRQAGCSSVFTPNFALWNRLAPKEWLEVLKTEEIPCNTLDGFLTEKKIKEVDFLKVDTQGAELAILKGSRKILGKSVFGIKVEVEFSPVYKNQPLFSEIDQYLRGLGFTLFDISPVRLKRKKYERVYSKGQVFWTDALYFKDLPGLEGDINFSVEKAVKTIAISELYGYPDFALELLDLYNSKKIINRKVYNEIKKILVRKTMKNILSLEYQLLTIIQPFIKLYLEEKKSSARNFYKLIKRKK